MGENGLPETDETEYRIVYDNDLHDYRVSLTTIRELKASILDEDGIPYGKETLPAGTHFTILGTDGETYVRMELDDGRQCRLHVEPKADGWGHTLDGVDENECFEFIPYAG